VSALARSEDQQRAISAGYDAFVAKPVEPTDLVQIAARLAGGACRRSENGTNG